MQTSGLFTLHKCTIPIPAVNESIRLVFFGDVHRDSPNFADAHWQDFLAYGKKTKNAWFIGMGDMLDSTSTSERECLSGAHKLHETIKWDLEKLTDAKVNMLAKELDFMKGKIVGFLNGNHYFEYQSGMNSDQKLCEKLGCKYLGVSSFIRIDFTCGGCHQVFDVWAHHGAGGARLIGGDINRVDQMREFADADAYCVDESTQILTVSGWKNRHEVNIGDLVAGFDVSTESIQWVPVLNKVQFLYDGNAVSVKNRNTDMLLHPKHRVVYKYKHGWLFAEAENFLDMGAQIKMPLAGYSNEESPAFSDDELALAGWIVAEGGFGPSGIKIYQKFQEKCDIIEGILVRLGLNWKKWKNKQGITEFYICASERARMARLFADKKMIPKWLSGVSGRQFAVFLEALTLGDGCVTGPVSVCIYSAIEKFIDDLQALCVTHGFRSIKGYKKGGFKDGGWYLCVTQRSTVDVCIPKRVKCVPYTGMTWCVTTPTSTFVARRNGKAFITGNCMGHTHKRSVVPANPKLRLENYNGSLHLKEHQQWIMRTGSFLKSYEDGKVSYNVDAARGPCSLGHVELEITWRRKESNGKAERWLQVRGIS